MQNLTIGVQILGARTGELLDNIVAAERAGIEVAWMTCGGLAPDPLAVFAAVARSTERIQFGSSIMPTFPRHPLALAQEALVVEQLAPGRLRLGVGTSTKRVIEGTFGIPFVRSQRELREYVTILKTLLGEGKVAYQGEVLSAQGSIGAPTGIRVMAAALHAQAYRLCGRVADGAISWVSPFRYLREQAAPALREGAEAAGRAKPPLIAHVAVAVCDDVEAVREAFRKQLWMYPKVPVYVGMFTQAGFPEASQGAYSDAMIDAILIAGNEEQVRTRLAELPSYGIDEALATLLPLGDEVTGRTLTLLGEAARGA